MAEKKIVNLIILKTEDEGKTWEPVEPDNIPDFIGTNEVVTELVAGNFCKENEDANTWYRGEVVETDYERFDGHPAPVDVTGGLDVDMTGGSDVDITGRFDDSAN